MLVNVMICKYCLLSNQMIETTDVGILLTTCLKRVRHQSLGICLSTFRLFQMKTFSWSFYLVSIINEEF